MVVADPTVMPRHSLELGREWDRDARNAAVAAHVLSILTGPLGPIAVQSQVKSDQPFARFHANQAMLFGVFAVPLVFLTCGVGLVIVAACAIYAAINAARGEWFAYPVIGRMAA